MIPILVALVIVGIIIYCFARDSEQTRQKDELDRKLRRDFGLGVETDEERRKRLNEK